jgi:dihydrofolate reductase
VIAVIVHAQPSERRSGRGRLHLRHRGIEQALEQAKAAAGDKYVTVMAGAEIGQQYI